MFDYSDFEGATHIADLNLPISGFDDRYNTIIDFGTMEHVFNAPQGLQNALTMCAVGGQIIHGLPANNQCNHGFWQFSPELFFSLYSSANGFVQTEVFIADVGEPDFWYRLECPPNGRWDYVASSRALYVFVRTVKGTNAGFKSVQQAAYVNDWAGQKSTIATRSLLQRIKNAMKEQPILSPLKSAYRRFLYTPNSALKQNRQMIKTPVASVL